MIPTNRLSPKTQVVKSYEKGNEKGKERRQKFSSQHMTFAILPSLRRKVALATFIATLGIHKEYRLSVVSVRNGTASRIRPI